MEVIHGFKWEDGKRVPVKILAVGYDADREESAIYLDENSLEIRSSRLYDNHNRKWVFVTGLVENK